jgi:hypothetical protein
MGGTGLWPVVSGVPPETVGEAGWLWFFTRKNNQTITDEIRRDAGFDGRDARATRLKQIPTKSSTTNSEKIPLTSAAICHSVICQ